MEDAAPSDRSYTGPLRRVGRTVSAPADFSRDQMLMSTHTHFYLNLQTPEGPEGTSLDVQKLV